MLSRRETLRHGTVVAGLLAASGLWALPAQARPAAFEAKSLAEVLKVLGKGAPSESKELTLTAPEIAENGAVVPLAVATGLANVRQLLLLVEKNPSPLVALFNVSEAVEPNFSTRSKMAESSLVYAVALLSDGRVLYTKKDVKVTLGGCGG